MLFGFVSVYRKHNRKVKIPQNGLEQSQELHGEEVIHEVLSAKQAQGDFRAVTAFICKDDQMAQWKPPPTILLKAFFL